MIDDELDACDIDFVEHASSEQEVELLPLFPNGPDEDLKRQWVELFGNGES